MSSRNLTSDKYLSKAETRRLFQTVRAKAVVDIKDGRMTWDKTFMLLDLAFHSGLRVSEIRVLTIKDIHLGHEPYIYVAHGKGDRSRKVLIPNGGQNHLIPSAVPFKAHAKEFIRRYNLSDDDYLLNIKGRPYSKMGLQKQFKRAIKEAELSADYSIHCARHTFAVYLYDQQKDLRAVQQQLGHADPATTAIYAQATKESIYESMNGIYQK